MFWYIKYCSVPENVCPMGYSLVWAVYECAVQRVCRQYGF